MHDKDPHLNIYCWNCESRLSGLVTMDKHTGKSFCCTPCMVEFGVDAASSAPPVRGSMPRTGGAL
jgi:hypothetical protein